MDENEKEKMWNENPEYNLKDLKKSEYNFEGLSVEDREFLMIDLNWINPVSWKDLEDEEQVKILDGMIPKGIRKRLSELSKVVEEQVNQIKKEEYDEEDKNFYSEYLLLWTELQLKSMTHSSKKFTD